MKLQKLIGSGTLAAVLFTVPINAQQSGPNSPPPTQTPPPPPQQPNNNDDRRGGVDAGKVIGIAIPAIIGLFGAKKLFDMRDRKHKQFTKNTVNFLFEGDLASARTFADAQGLRDIEIEELDTIGATLVSARVAKKQKPDSQVALLATMAGVIEVEREGLFQQMGSVSGATIPLANASAPVIAGTMMAAGSGGNVSVAMIDSLVDIDHENLKNGWIRQLNFTGSTKDSIHGTAIASLIAGRGQVSGKAAGQKLYSFAAFSAAKGNKPGVARTRSLAKALNAAARVNPHVLNMSFGGPNDAILTRILKRMYARGTCMVAATGNGGKKARPPFPARLSEVIGITAVDKKMRAYKYATPGFHVGAAASGVKRLTAVPGGYRIASGTSFASADVAGQLSRSSICTGRRGKGLKSRISRSARDLGAPGRDDVYGYGLFRL